MPSGADALVLHCVEELGIKYGHERSCKLRPGGLLSNRFLLGLRKQRIGEQADRKILEICATLGMPVELLRAYREQLPESNYVHFGFEEHETGCLFKAYLEFYDRVDAGIRAGGPRQPSYLMHLGFKWPVSGARGAVVTRYEWHPFIELDAMRSRIDAILQGSALAVAREAVNSMLTAASLRVAHHDIFYLEASEEGNPRCSFDINLYRAKLAVAQVESALAAVCAGYGVPEDQLSAVCAPAGSSTFGHVSAGVDRTGSEFLTAYFGVQYRERSDVAAQSAAVSRTAFLRLY